MQLESEIVVAGKDSGLVCYVTLELRIVSVSGEPSRPRILTLTDTTKGYQKDTTSTRKKSKSRKKGKKRAKEEEEEAKMTNDAKPCSVFSERRRRYQTSSSITSFEQKDTHCAGEQTQWLKLAQCCTPTP